MHAKLSKIATDGFDIFLFAALRIGIINPQQELSAKLLRKHPVVQRGADIPDMQAAGGRRGETGNTHAVCGSQHPAHGQALAHRDLARLLPPHTPTVRLCIRMNSAVTLEVQITSFSLR